MTDRGVRRAVRAAGVPVVVAGLMLGGVVAERATGTDPTRCEVHATDAQARAELVTGSGPDLLVVGDSWSVGLGLDDPRGSWPTRLPGTVHVAGFSGSGFGAAASGCGPEVSFAARVPEALRRVPAGTPVVVEGGLNDWDQPAAEVRAGFEELLRALEGHPVTVVGPAAAPARAAYVPRVEALLRRLCAAHDVAFVATSDLRLDYLTDLLHPTAAGHAAFGDAVAARLG